MLSTLEHLLDQCRLGHFTSVDAQINYLLFRNDDWGAFSVTLDSATGLLTRLYDGYGYTMEFSPGKGYRADVEFPKPVRTYTGSSYMKSLSTGTQDFWQRPEHALVASIIATLIEDCTRQPPTVLYQDRINDGGVGDYYVAY